MKKRHLSITCLILIMLYSCLLGTLNFVEAEESPGFGKTKVQANIEWNGRNGKEFQFQDVFSNDLPKVELVYSKDGLPSESIELHEASTVIEFKKIYEMTDLEQDNYYLEFNDFEISDDIVGAYYFDVSSSWYYSGDWQTHGDITVQQVRNTDVIITINGKNDSVSLNAKIQLNDLEGNIFEISGNPANFPDDLHSRLTFNVFGRAEALEEGITFSVVNGNGEELELVTDDNGKEYKPVIKIDPAGIKATYIDFVEQVTYNLVLNKVTDEGVETLETKSFSGSVAEVTASIESYAQEYAQNNLAGYALSEKKVEEGTAGVKTFTYTYKQVEKPEEEKPEEEKPEEEKPTINDSTKHSQIVFYPDGGSWEDGSKDAKVLECNIGDLITIPEGPKKAGAKFLYWEGSKYYPGEKYLVEGDHVFTARYDELPEVDSFILFEAVNDKPEIELTEQEISPTASSPSTSKPIASPENLPKTGEQASYTPIGITVTVAGLAMLIALRKKLGK